MKRIILTAGLGLLAAATACGPTETELACGAGVNAEVNDASYCVYKQELIIEGFECPQGLNRFDIEDAGLTVCGENPMRPPIEHIEELKEQYGNPVQCQQVPTCQAGQVELNTASCQLAGASSTASGSTVITVMLSFPPAFRADSTRPSTAAGREFRDMSWVRASTSTRSERPSEHRRSRSPSSRSTCTVSVRTLGYSPMARVITFRYELGDTSGSIPPF